MPDSDQTEVLRQLAAMRQELRLMRGLLLFLNVVTGLFLFAPAVAVAIVAASAQAWVFLTDKAAPAIGVGVAVAFSAVVVSWRAGRKPAETAGRTGEEPVA